ncbi:MAG: hypothetical protein ACLRZ2_01585 [Veillonella sp.]
MPSKEENARNGLPETDWRDAQYGMLYLPLSRGRGSGRAKQPRRFQTDPHHRQPPETYNGTTYYYDELGNLIHRELADSEMQNYFYDLHDQLVKAEIFKKTAAKRLGRTATTP